MADVGRQDRLQGSHQFRHIVLDLFLPALGFLEVWAILVERNWARIWWWTLPPVYVYAFWVAKMSEGFLAPGGIGPIFLLFVIPGLMIAHLVWWIRQLCGTLSNRPPGWFRSSRDGLLVVGAFALALTSLVLVWMIGIAWEVSVPTNEIMLVAVRAHFAAVGIVAIGYALSLRRSGIRSDPVGNVLAVLGPLIGLMGLGSLFSRRIGEGTILLILGWFAICMMYVSQALNGMKTFQDWKLPLNLLLYIGFNLYLLGWFYGVAAVWDHADSDDTATGETRPDTSHQAP